MDKEISRFAKKLILAEEAIALARVRVDLAFNQCELDGDATQSQVLRDIWTDMANMQAAVAEMYKEETEPLPASEPTG